MSIPMRWGPGSGAIVLSIMLIPRAGVLVAETDRNALMRRHNEASYINSMEITCSDR